MTDHLHALAMRTKAANACKNVRINSAMSDAEATGALECAIAILALPLEADHAALIREAARLVIAKWDADTASGLVYGPNEFAALIRALALDMP